MSATPDDLRREASRWHGRNEPLRCLLLNAAEALELANLQRAGADAAERAAGDLVEVARRG